MSNTLHKSRKYTALALAAVFTLLMLQHSSAVEDEKGGGTCCKSGAGKSAGAETKEDTGGHEGHGAAAAKSDDEKTSGGQKSCCFAETKEPGHEGGAHAANGDSANAGQGGMKGRGGQGHGGRGGMMQSAHELIANHKKITRTFEEIDGGVKSLTVTSDPALVATLREHVRQMSAMLESGGGVRHWDPLFVEVARHSDKIKMEYKDVENGIEVIETSKDPEVVKLIRAHAAKVSEFVARGHEAMRESTKLPEGYTPPK